MGNLNGEGQRKASPTPCKTCQSCVVATGVCMPALKSYGRLRFPGPEKTVMNVWVAFERCPKRFSTKVSAAGRKKKRPSKYVGAVSE